MAKNKALQTTTLGLRDDPTTVLCPGHVSAKTFNRAFISEGWSDAGYKQKNLRYEYWRTLKANRKSHDFRMKKSVPGKPGAQAVTVADWD